MLIFIENTPRAYAWGSRDALPELLGRAPTGEPQAELWLGAHPGDPAKVAKGAPEPRTLIDLIERDPQRYGVDGGQLPFLLKVLAIGMPLSLQVHPSREQARVGFEAEEAAGVPLDAFERNYGDPNHKPELLVALSEVSALAGFRPLSEAREDLRAFAELSVSGPGRDALNAAARLCSPSLGDELEARRAYLTWALSGSEESAEASRALRDCIAQPGATPPGVDAHRVAAVRLLGAAYPDDPGLLVSLLLHLVQLEPGEAIYLGARQLHAYLSGIGVEVMAASDNVLRAGLTKKHIDVPELLKIVDLGDLEDPRFEPRLIKPGLTAWEPDVPDFCLFRARVCEPSDREDFGSEDVPHGEGSGGSHANRHESYSAERSENCAEVIELPVDYPLVLIVTSGRVRVERPSADFDEVASVGRGQSLYVSAGEPIELSGVGEAFLATVGKRI